MDKRKTYLILLAIVGVIVLTIGIKAAIVYGQPYGTYDQLNPQWALEQKHAIFTTWLMKWIILPIVAFVTLTAALVVSRLITDKTKPPPSRS